MSETMHPTCDGTMEAFVPLPWAAESSPRLLREAEQVIELSIVMPCLNEADTLAVCVHKAQRALASLGVSGEVIVADNGSTDGSQLIATAAGARLVSVESKGYGSALMGGIAAARGRYVLMGDADDSYDFMELGKFVDRLRAGYELVQGCRLSTGGGTVLPGAMPFLHRWWGNPMFSLMARKWFGASIHDVHCGMRAFTKELYEHLDHRCLGMEFASEMVIKASLGGARMCEVPITLHPDGRTSHSPHLRTFRDGWRHLRFYLMFSPRWLFLLPGAALIALGLLGYGVAMPAMRIRGVVFDVHTLLFASLSVICGYQSILFAALTQSFGMAAGFLPSGARMRRLYEIVNLERGLLAGVGAGLTGSILLLAAVLQWRTRHWGTLNYEVTMRWVIPGVTLTALGFQTALSSFFLSILGLARR